MLLKNVFITFIAIIIASFSAQAENNTAKNTNISDVIYLTSDYFAEEKEEYMESIAYYLKEAKKTKNVNLFIKVYKILVNNNKIKSAKKIIKTIVSELKRPEFILLLGLLEYKNISYKIAIEYLLEYLKLKTKDKYVNIANGLYIIDYGKWYKKILIDLRFDSPEERLEFKFIESLVDLLNNNENNAFKTLKDVLSKTTDRKKYVISYISLMQKFEKHAEAKAVFNYYFKTYTDDDVDLLNLYSLILINNNELDEAYKVLNGVLAKGGSLFTFSALAKVLYKQKFYNLAKKYYVKVIKEKKNPYKEYYYLGRINEHLKNYEKAVKWYSKVEGDFKIKAYNRLQYIDKYGLNDKPFDNLDPENLNLNSFKVKTLIDFGIYDKETLKRPYELELFILKALIKEKKGDKVGFIEDIKKGGEALFFFENFSLIKKVVLLLDKDSDLLPKIKKYLEAKLKSLPNQAADIMETLGYIYYKQEGNVRKSLNLLEKSYRLNPNSETIAITFGEVLWHAKKYKNAEKIWNKALKESKDYKTILDKIREIKNKNSNNK